MRKLLLIPLLFLLVFSCSTRKDILYMQDIDDYNFEKFSFTEYKISVDDILKIDVETVSSDLELILNQNYSNPGTKDYWLFEGYQVNSDGKIFINDIGEIYVLGSTVKSIRKLIYDELVSQGIYVNPIVNVKVINKSYTILGEVNMLVYIWSPCTHVIRKNHNYNN